MKSRLFKTSQVAARAAFVLLALAGPALSAPHTAPRRTEAATHSELRTEASSRLDRDEARPAPQPLGALLYATPAQVRARFGDPDVSRAEGKGAFWTYRMPHCALFLFLQDGAHGLKVSGAATGPRKRGEPVLTVEACLAQAIETPEQ